MNAAKLFIPLSFLTAFAALGCGNGDPSGAGPAPPTSTATPPSPTSAAPDAAAATTDAGAHADTDAKAFPEAGPPSFRDPVAPDGGCLAPNMLCAPPPAAPDPDAGVTVPGLDDGGAGGDAGGPLVCTAITRDPSNCGACGNVCAGPTATCIGGACACDDPTFAYCAAAGCMDVSSDPNNCGACGNVCQPTEDCIGSQCVAMDDK